MENLKEKYGNTKELLVPSGYKVIIREQNGDDDDLISNVALSESGTSFNMFIASLVVWSELTGKPLTMEDVLSMKLRDKYFVLMSSRVFSIGPILKFKYDWKDGKPPVHYEDDLRQYLWDYNEEIPGEREPRYFKYRIKPYPNGKDSLREFTLTSGKEVRYKYINGYGEKYLLELGNDMLTINAELKARELELKVDSKWYKVENFKPFTARDMQELRADVAINDERFDGLTDLENPSSGNTATIPLIGIQDFFFPRGV
jgi:hypothetical protein